MTREITQAEAEALLEALKEAHDHLEYCGYGDAWERECAEARGLAGKIEAAIASVKSSVGEPE